MTETNGPATHITIRDALVAYGRAVEARALDQAQIMTWRLLTVGAINIPVLTHLAEHLYGIGELLRARCFARIAAVTEPDMPRPYRLLLAMVASANRADDLRIGAWAHTTAPSDAITAVRAATLARLAGDRVAAIRYFRQALAARPYSARTWSILAAELRITGEEDQSTNAARRAGCLAPGLSVAMFAAGEAAVAAFDHAATAKHFGRALKIDPFHAPAYEHRGHALRRQGRLESAVIDYHRSLILQPAQVVVHTALAQLTLASGDVARVRFLFRRGAAIDPASPEAGFFGALTDLRVGRFEAGWAGYDWFSKLGFPRLSRKQRLPRWPTEESAPTGLLAWNDQFGIGEQVMYLSAASELVARIGSLMISCSPKLETLVRRSFPDAVVTSPDAVANRDPNLGARPAEDPLIATTAVLRRSFDDFPAHKGYLTADPELVAILRERYRDPAGRPLIGISWSSPLGFQGPRKSVPLVQWGPVFKALDARFVSLQYHADPGEIAKAREQHGVEILMDEELDTFADLDAHAAQIAAMDRVISISSIAAHLAGALGKPVDMLYPSEIVLLWYWFHGRADSPWYPSMTIHRPPRDGDREALMIAVAQHLAGNRPTGAEPE